jgi:hypothetical protein
MGHFMQASLEIAPNTELYEPTWQKPDGWDNPVALQNIPWGHGTHEVLSALLVYPEEHGRHEVDPV